MAEWFDYNFPPSMDEIRPWHYVRAKGYVPKGSKKDSRLYEEYDPKYVGKWLVFVSVLKMNEVWKQIGEATLDFDLGIASKIATMFPTRFDSNTKVICVYTKDYRNEIDVFRVRAKLREMGFGQTLYYKTDDMTRQGKYSGPESWLYKD